MADEVKETPATEQPAVQAEAAKVVADAVTKAEFGQLQEAVSALTDTLKGALTPRPVVPGETAKPGELPAHFRQLLRQQGLTDADINANAPIIVPFLSAMLATDGQVLLGATQQVQDEVEVVKAARNKKKYPYWDEVEEKVEELRATAKKEGRYLTPSDAYQTAVALDVAGSESRIEQAKARVKAKAESNSDDVQDFGTHKGTPRTVARTAKTADDLAGMSRADRKKFFESIGDVPIR